MKRVGYILAIIVLLALGTIPVAYAFWRINDIQFRDSFMGNWFATMIGVMVGIPIALEINRRQRKVQERTEKVVREREQLARTAKILKLVKKELTHNREALVGRQQTEDGTSQRVVSTNRLKDELWNAFSDGGELQWITDLELLDSISAAYHHIRTVIYLEERYFEATHFPGMVVRQDKYPKDYIIEYLTHDDPMVLEHINKALADIERSLLAIENPKSSPLTLSA